MSRKYSLWTLSLLLMALTFSACDKDDDVYLPPNSAIVKALKELYPTAQNISWEQKRIYFVADCWVEGTELDVWFDANANWVMTERDLFLEQLPASVYTSFQEGGYADWVIDNLTQLTFPEQMGQFVIEVEKGNKEMALYYSEYGGLLHEENITNADDTHWPNITGLTK